MKGSSKLVMENKLTLISVSILTVLLYGENWANFNYLLLDCLSSASHYRTTLSELFKLKYTLNYIHTLHIYQYHSHFSIKLDI